MHTAELEPVAVDPPLEDVLDADDEGLAVVAVVDVIDVDDPLDALPPAVEDEVPVDAPPHPPRTRRRAQNGARARQERSLGAAASGDIARQA